MVKGLAVLVSSLITLPVPGYAVRDEASFALESPEKLIAEELMRHAKLLQMAFDVQTTGAPLSVGLRHQLAYNQFFATCGLSNLAVRELAGDELQLRALGKLAKSGNFFASIDSRWLVKAVSFEEKSKLAELGKVKISDTEYSNCTGFNHSLLLPIPLAFIGTNRKAYLVMQNETNQLARRISPEWQVKQIFDVKPLPNLAGQLAELVSALSKGWLGSFEPLTKWDGWDDVSNALHHDCQLLTLYKVVDFSLFIHVLQRTPAIETSSIDLSAKDGCITEPSQAAIVCFAILDYLLPFGQGRKLESHYKGHKFQDYGKKLMRAFACIGDLNGEGCEAYHDYSAILGAGDAQGKAALLGSQTFRHNYVCQVERPKLLYEHKTIVGDTFVPVGVHDVPVNRRATESWSDETVRLLPEAMHSGSWSYDGIGYDANVTAWLQDAVSSNSGGHVVASEYEQHLKSELGQPDTGFRLHKQELAACKQGIESFATSSWRGHSNHKDLGNIIWSPRSNSIFVVRGKNNLYSNSNVVTEMRKKHCFMLVRFFRCQAVDGQRTIFDYKTSFGPLEVLQVVPSTSSGDDFRVFRQWVTPLAG